MTILMNASLIGSDWPKFEHYLKYLLIQLKKPVILIKSAYLAIKPDIHTKWNYQLSHCHRRHHFFQEHEMKTKQTIINGYSSAYFFDNFPFFLVPVLLVWNPSQSVLNFSQYFSEFEESVFWPRAASRRMIIIATILTLAALGQAVDFSILKNIG